MNSKLLPCLALVLGSLAGCCSAPGSFRTRMSQAAVAALPNGVQQTEFACIGDVHTAKGTYYVAVQRLILSDMMAPQGEPTCLLLFSDKARLVAAYQADFFTGMWPLWCEGSRVYLAGFSALHLANSVNQEIPPSPHLARFFAGSDGTPTGNVIDFSRGPRKPFLTREKRYGSSGGLEDDPWKLLPLDNTTQNLLLSFPNRLKPGEEVVGFGLHIQNGQILAIKKVPFDWIVKLCAEAPMSDMSGFPNHDAGAFQNMAPLQRFVTVHKDWSPFRVTGYLVLTRNFTRQWTNFLTTSNFVLERIKP